MVIDFQWCKSPHEETFSTWKIIQSSKCFFFDFRTLAVSWSTRYASAERAELRDSCTTCARVETSKARVPRVRTSKARVIDTNELLRGRTDARWASNRKLKNELRRARMSSSTNYYAGGTNTLLHRRTRSGRSGPDPTNFFALFLFLFFVFVFCFLSRLKANGFAMRLKWNRAWQVIIWRK